VLGAGTGGGPAQPGGRGVAGPASAAQSPHHGAGPPIRWYAPPTLLTPHSSPLTFPLGRSWSDKVQDVRDEVRREGAAALVLAAMDEIACE